MLTTVPVDARARCAGLNNVEPGVRRPARSQCPATNTSVGLGDTTAIVRTNFFVNLFSRQLCFLNFLLRFRGVRDCCVPEYFFVWILCACVLCVVPLLGIYRSNLPPFWIFRIGLLVHIVKDRSIWASERARDFRFRRRACAASAHEH